MKVNKDFIRDMLVYLIFISTVIAIFNFLILPIFGGKKIKETDYSFFLSQVDEGNVTKVNIKENEILFEAENKDGSTSRYSTGKIDDPELVSRLYEKGNIEFTASFESNNIVLEFIVSWVLPIIFFALLWNVFMKGMGKRMGGGNAMSFGKSNAKIYVKAQTGKTFKDVAGQDEAKDALVEIVDFLITPTSTQK